MDEREKVWLIYPEYFDSRFSVRLGRKVPLKYSIENPTLDEVIEAARKSGLRVVRIERDKFHPSNWIERKGRIVILKPDKKTKRAVLIEISKNLRIVRKKNLERRKKEQKRKKKRKDLDKYLERILKK